MVSNIKYFFFNSTVLVSFTRSLSLDPGYQLFFSTPDLPYEPKRKSECCEDRRDSKWCEAVIFNEHIVLEKKYFTVYDTGFFFSNKIPPNGFVFKTAKGEGAVINVNQDSGRMMGHFKYFDTHTSGYRNIVVQMCRADGGYFAFEFKEDLETSNSYEILAPHHIHK